MTSWKPPLPDNHLMDGTTAPSTSWQRKWSFPENRGTPNGWLIMVNKGTSPYMVLPFFPEYGIYLYSFFFGGCSVCKLASGILKLRPSGSSCLLLPNVNDELSYGGFHRHGGTTNGWCLLGKIGKSQSKMDDEDYPVPRTTQETSRWFIKLEATSAGHLFTQDTGGSRPCQPKAIRLVNLKTIHVKLTPA